MLLLHGREEKEKHLHLDGVLESPAILRFMKSCVGKKLSGKKQTFLTEN